MRYRVILAQMVSRTAVHVGTGTASDVTDDLCRRNVQGQFVIPGTAIGGALRSVATRLAPRLGSPYCKALMQPDSKPGRESKPCRCWTCHLFGDIEPVESQADQDAPDQNPPVRASRLVVAAAKANLKSKPPGIRDGVGVDRASRSAARGVKFDMEVLPAGTEFDLRLELEECDDNDELVLAAALGEWEQGRCWIGGRSARGLGAFALKNLRLVELDFSRPEKLMAFLKADEPWQAATKMPNWLGMKLSSLLAEPRPSGSGPLEGTISPVGADGGQSAGQAPIHETQAQKESPSSVDVRVARSFATFTFKLCFEDLFLTSDALAEAMSGFDRAPLLDVIDTGTGRAILPGASLRGVLRSQAEKIVRTLETLETSNPDDFLKTCPACNPVESNVDAALANCSVLLRKKAGASDREEVNETRLCPACRLFGSSLWGSRLIVEDALGVIPSDDNSRKMLDFVAIDRFTGGARDKAKFDALALWRPILDVSIHLDNPLPGELGWLWLVLRDLKEGMLTVGHGAAKGFGRASIRDCKIRHGIISDGDFPGPAELARLQERPTSGVYRIADWQAFDGNAELTRLLKGWLDEFAGLRKFKREDSLKQDSYFVPELPTYYPKDAYRCLIKG
ncbi:MAG: RAMP superfamily CRISPR-associated protein [Acidobacteriota bacterium]